MDTYNTTAAAAARALAAEQEQVGALLGRIFDADFDAAINPLALERLMLQGHFPDYFWELDFTPRYIAGHLRDSATIFAERIRRVRDEDRPELADFVTDDPARFEDHDAATPDQLRDQVAAAQEQLLAAVAAVPEAELDRAGEHAVDGVVRLRDMLAFLPGHQRDHREQLAAFTAAPLG